MYFDEKTYRSGKKYQSKYETHYFVKVATNVMFTHISAKASINKFGEKAVAAMIREFREKGKCPMPRKPVVNQINLDTLSFDEKGNRVSSNLPPAD